jgi:hypothetical protein
MEPLPPELVNDSDAVEKHGNEYAKRLSEAPKIIPDKLGDPSKTPLTLAVGKGGMAELTVDVSEHK